MALGASSAIEKDRAANKHRAQEKQYRIGNRHQQREAWIGRIGTPPKLKDELREDRNGRCQCRLRPKATMEEEKHTRSQQETYDCDDSRRRLPRDIRRRIRKMLSEYL